MTINRNGNGDPGWFLRWIEIDGGHRFSFYKTITDGVFSSRKDTLLPQDESSQYNLDLRNCYLAEQKLKYGYELYNGGDLELPVKTNSVLPEARMFMSQEIVILKNWLPKRWRAFVEINTAYQMYFKTPKGNINWENDLHFAQQRLNQCNSSLIRRVIDQREIANIMNIRKRVRRHSSASMSEKKSCVLIVTVMIVFILSEIPRLVLNTSVITTYASDLGKENIAWNKVKDEIEKESTVCFKRAEDSVLTTILSDLKFCDIEHLNNKVQTVCENKNYSNRLIWTTLIG
ncbi:unnamed protein product [Mytilus edulis]|uniref:Uncharacterized protein n=1 Tax=Mytilus edulis TaxID=6550 RepID=A0A8S3UY49_MYTED|nr:unnamed protein product [Mytilus edulis]